MSGGEIIKTPVARGMSQRAAPSNALGELVSLSQERVASCWSWPSVQLGGWPTRNRVVGEVSRSGDSRASPR